MTPRSRMVWPALAALTAALTTYGGAVSVAAHGRTAATCGGHSATIVGHTSMTRGTPHDDVIIASGTILGRGGNDVICGRGGPDLIEGGPGRDRVYGREGDDVLAGQGGKDRLLANGGADVLKGGRGDDYLAGGADDVRHHGVVIGADTLVGGPGDDQLEADHDRHSGPASPHDPRDTISYVDSPRAVTVDLRTGLVSGDGHDRIVSHQDLAILGSAYADHITGSNQYRELLDGRGGSDVVHGGGSSDVVLSTDAAHDQLFGDAGRDIVSGSARDTLAGGPGDDTLAGASLDAGTLSLIDPWQPGPGGAADGGPGDDSLTLLSPHNRVAQLDLAQGTFTFDDRGSFPVSAVEHVAWLGDALIYHGTEAADELDASRASSSQGITAFMGAGDDRVVGTTVRDYLDGGDGTDWVDGHGGTDDVCVAFEEGSC